MVSTYPTTQFVLHSVERNGVQKELLGKPQNGEKRCFLWVFEDSKSNFVTRSLHSHFIWVFSLDSVERNGEQKAFLGKLQKGEKSCFVWVWDDSTSNFVNPQLHSHFIWVSTVHSHLWVRMHMQFGFRFILHVPFFFSRSFSGNYSSLLCRSFSVRHLQNRLGKKIWHN